MNETMESRKAAIQWLGRKVLPGRSLCADVDPGASGGPVAGDEFLARSINRISPITVVTSIATQKVVPTKPSSARQSTIELWAVISLKSVNAPKPTPKTGARLKSCRPVDHASKRSDPWSIEILRPLVKPAPSAAI